jgi:hypothetical protein
VGNLFNLSERNISVGASLANYSPESSSQQDDSLARFAVNAALVLRNLTAGLQHCMECGGCQFGYFVRR